MSQLFNVIKFAAAAVSVTFAAAAFAGTDDGNVQGNVSQQVASQPAPAPLASAATVEKKFIDSGIVSPNP